MPYKYNDGSRSDDLIKRMIPVMILWAKYSWTEEHTYTQLMEAIDAKSPRLGHQLGLIDDIFCDLSQKYKTVIPTLNALISGSGKGIPSNGLDYVDSIYSKLSKEEKELFAKVKNQDAHNYDYTWVLDKLGLKLPTNIPANEIESIRAASRGCMSGESNYHKRLKEYISSNPEVISIYSVTNVSTEYNLLSGDRLDVFIKTENEIWGIEVKSRISDDNDIIRGIYQCVKYKAVMEAEKALNPDTSIIKILLVVERDISPKLKSLASFLNVQFISDFKIPT